MDIKQTDTEMKQKEYKNEKSEKEKSPEEIQEEMQKQSPILTISELMFFLSVGDSELTADEREETRKKALTLIEQHSMYFWYQSLCKKQGLMEDDQLSAKLKTENEKQLKMLEDKILEAEINSGDAEIREAKLAKANYLATIGDKDNAIKAYEETLEKTVGSGGRIDIMFAIIRLALAHNDMPLLKTHIAKAKSFVEKGGDWERRNLLHVYESVYLVLIREFSVAAKLLLDSVATFTCYALFDYNRLIFYSVLSSLISLDRVTLRDRVIKSPEVLTVIREMPQLQDLLMSLYKCQYQKFFVALSTISPQLKRDQYIASHFNYFLREIRIVAYRQFLEPYRSITLASMANAFGVSFPFLDRELSRFISAGRLNCKIDKVSGIVETNRPDVKNAQYQAIVKQGDLLLNRIQKLTRVTTY